MKNLAGNKECDIFIMNELAEAGIELVNVGPSNREVPYTVEGKLGPFKFWRAWYYWVVEGPMPMEIARRIHRDMRGKDVRTEGHGGNPDPEEWKEKSIAEYEKYLPYLQDGVVPPDLVDLTEIAPSKTLEEVFGEFADVMERLRKRAMFINCYHVDSQEGLNFLSATIKQYGLDKQPEEQVEGGYIGAFGIRYGSIQDNPDQRKHEGAIHS